MKTIDFTISWAYATEIIIAAYHCCDTKERELCFDQCCRMIEVIEMAFGPGASELKEKHIETFLKSLTEDRVERFHAADQLRKLAKSADNAVRHLEKVKTN